MLLLWERENGKITINRKPVDFNEIPDYLHSQKRFDRINDEITNQIMADAKNRYETLLRLAELEIV